MIDLLSALLAIVTPWLAAYFLLNCIIKNRLKYNLCFLVGLSFFVGMSLVLLLLVLVNLLGYGLSVIGVYLSLSIILMVSIFMQRKNSIPCNYTTQYFELSWVEKSVFLFFLMLIIAHLILVAIELYYRPLFPWDAWMSWGYKARVWFETKQLLYIPEDWAYFKYPDSYYVAGSRHPIPVSLIQTWMALNIGEWHESLINLPWLFAVIAFGFCLWGTAMKMQISPLMAILVLYLFSSLPFLNVHIALAGNADLWLGCVWGLSIMHFFSWMQQKQKIDLLLFGFWLFATIFIKDHAYVFVVITLVAFAFLYAIKRSIYYYLLAVALSVGLLVCFIFVIDELIELLNQMDFKLIAKFFKSLAIQYYPETWEAIFNALSTLNNWHLFWVILFGLFARLLFTKDKTADQIAAMSLITSWALFMVVIFVFTKYSKIAMDYTGINRYLLSCVFGFVVVFLVAVKSLKNK